MSDFFGSDFILIASALAGLALTSLGIVRDFEPLRSHANRTGNMDSQVVTS